MAYQRRKVGRNATYLGAAMGMKTSADDLHNTLISIQGKRTINDYETHGGETFSTPMYRMSTGI